MELEHEKFNMVKELADISTNISNARVELTKLRETTDEYLDLREKEAQERVVKVFKESREALEEVSKNHKELTDFNGELKAYANTLKAISTDIIALFENFNGRMERAGEDMKKNQEIVTDILTKIKIERVQVQEDRKLLVAEMREVEEQHRLLKDKREVLDRAWAELKRLQNNKENI